MTTTEINYKIHDLVMDDGLLKVRESANAVSILTQTFEHENTIRNL